MATYQNGIAGVWKSIGFISFHRFTLLILGYKEQKEKSLFDLLWVCCLFIFTMFSGHRGHQLTIILFLAYIVHMTFTGLEEKIPHIYICYCIYRVSFF